jgi:hypothetical protein
MEKSKIDVKRTIEHHNKVADIAIQLFVKTGADPLKCWSMACEMANFISAKSDELKQRLEKQTAADLVKDL